MKISLLPTQNIRGVDIYPLQQRLVIRDNAIIQALALMATVFICGLFSSLFGTDQLKESYCGALLLFVLSCYDVAAFKGFIWIQPPIPTSPHHSQMDSHRLQWAISPGKP